MEKLRQLRDSADPSSQRNRSDSHEKRHASKKLKTLGGRSSSVAGTRRNTLFSTLQPQT